MRKFLLLLLLSCPLLASAQILKKATWEYHLEPADPKAGEEAELVFKLDIAKDWYVYSSDFDPDLGPVVASFEFEENDSYEVVGDIVPVGQKEKYDDLWEGNYTYFVEKGEFRQKLRVLKNDFTVKGSYGYQVCSEITGQCVLGEGEFEAIGGT
ncbi:MAG: protein-disulfide reductase DsbD domain-containing protein, partial [Bacteroidota bacterium]